MPFGRRIKKKGGGARAEPKKVFPRILSECKQGAGASQFLQCTELVQLAGLAHWLDIQARARIWHNPRASQALKFLL